MGRSLKVDGEVLAALNVHSRETGQTMEELVTEILVEGLWWRGYIEVEPHRRGDHVG